MADGGSPGPEGEQMAPGEGPKGLEGAIARGAAAKEAWVRDGLLVSRESLAQRWGVSLEDVAAMVERGELFELEAVGQRWVPAVFLELPRDVVAEVNQALTEASADASVAFVFWHRKHGTLTGRTVVDAIRSVGGPYEVAQLARSLSASSPS